MISYIPKYVYDYLYGESRRMIRLDRRFLILFVAVFLIFLICAVYYYHKTVQPQNDISYVDFKIFWKAGFRVQMNRNIYELGDGYLVYKYSPVFAVTMSTFRLMNNASAAQALCAWYVVLFVSFIISLYAVKEILYDNPHCNSPTPDFFAIVPLLFIFRYFIVVNFIPDAPHSWPLFIKLCDKLVYLAGIAYMISLFFTRKNALVNDYLKIVALAVLANMSFVTLNIDRAQVNILILALLLLFARSLVKGRDLTSGVYLGAATAIKIFPAIFLIYLVCKRRFKAFFSSVFVLLIFLFIPSVRWGLKHNIEVLKDWAGLLRTTFPIEYIDSKNQSLLSMTARFFSKESDVSIIGLDPRYQPIVIAIVYIIFLSVLIYAVTKKKKGADGSEGTIYDISLFFIAMTILSPICSKTNFVYALLPVGLLAKEAFRRGLKDRYINFGILAYAVPAYLISPTVVGNFAVLLNKYSIMTFCFLILFSVTIYAKLKEGPSISST